MNNKLSFRVLAPAWELAAFSLRYPTDTLVDAVASLEWQDAAEEILTALGAEYDKSTLDLQKYQGTHKDDLLHTLRVEATALFIGAPGPKVSPYEGIWRAKQDGVEGLLFVNPHSMDVERFMEACGLTRPDDTNEPLDHIATECEFLQHLATLCVLQEDETELPDNLVLDKFPGKSPQKAYQQFLTEHLFTWVDEFIAALKTETQESFYLSAASYLEALVKYAQKTEEVN